MSAIAIRLVSRGVAAQEFESAVSDYYQNLEDTTNFDPQELITLLAERSAIDPSIIEQEFFNQGRFIDALFSDAVEALKLASKTHTLGIFSQGNQLWQEQKLSLSGIDTYFSQEHRIIAHRKLSPEIIQQLKTGSVVIDDKFAVVATLAAKRPDLQLFWVNKAAEEPQEPVPATVIQIKSLQEVFEKLR